MTGARQVSTNAQPTSLARRKLQAVPEQAIGKELMQYKPQFETKGSHVRGTARPQGDVYQSIIGHDTFSKARGSEGRLLKTNQEYIRDAP
jgi:hypothetical protein